MNNNNLDIVSEAIIKTIEELDIDIVDKLEILINLQNFLDKGQYKENIKILQRRNKKCRCLPKENTKNK